MSSVLDGYWTVECGKGLLVLRRTEKRSSGLAAFLQSFAGVYEVLAPAEPGDTQLLIDMRASLGRNDPEFEADLVEPRRELFQRFARSCVLVQTAVGRLQVQRHIDEDGFSGRVKVFDDEQAARAWLAS